MQMMPIAVSAPVNDIVGMELLHIFLQNEQFGACLLNFSRSWEQASQK